jgi:serine O-acetyltransferase
LSEGHFATRSAGHPASAAASISAGTVKPVFSPKIKIRLFSQPLNVYPLNGIKVAHLFYRENLPVVPRIMTEWAHSRTGIDISPGTEIGSHFFIDHGTGVVIGETSKIGSNVKLYQGVALIARSLSAGQAVHGQKRHPTIEDNVTVYSGSSIMGGDTVIGAGSTIGANVFLTHSVPPRSVVYFDKGKLQIRSKDNRPGGVIEDWAI